MTTTNVLAIVMAILGIGLIVLVIALFVAIIKFLKNNLN